MQKKKTGIELDNNISAIHKTKKKKTKKKIGRGRKKTSFKAHQKYSHRAGGCWWQNPQKHKCEEKIIKKQKQQARNNM